MKLPPHYHPDRPGRTWWGKIVHSWEEFRLRWRRCGGCGRIGRRKRAHTWDYRGHTVCCDGQCWLRDRPDE